MGLIVFFIICFSWPIGDGVTPQHITSTYGEFRDSSGLGCYCGNHIHDGVDIVSDDNTVHGVEPAEVVDIVEETYSRSIHTKWHDFFHMSYIDVRPRDTAFVWTYLSNYGSHLHFTSRMNEWEDVGDSSCLYTNNPIDPSFSTAWRFDCLEPDYNPPYFESFSDPYGSDGILFVQDENPYYVLDPNNINERYVDVLVRAYENTAYPGGYDDNNGVYKIGYSIDWGSADSINIHFDQWDGNNWEVSYIFDTTRCAGPPNYHHAYVITNHMDSDGWIDMGSFQVVGIP